MKFEECAACAAKPGSPTLCRSCLHNRNTIALLTERLKQAIEIGQNAMKPWDLYHHKLEKLKP